jgi:aquaporin NIP
MADQSPLKDYIAELIGTYTLVFCGTGAIVIAQQTNGAVSHAGVAVTFGLIVMSLIYALGNISGAHLNPAVSIAFTIARRFPAAKLPGYMFSQVTGALLASVTLKFLFPANQYLGGTIPAGTDMQSFVLELLLTFFLMLVILRVAHGSNEQGMFAGIAIGAVVGLEAMFAGPICGASMNPARSIAPAIASGHLEHLWIYIAAPIIGATLAVPVCNYLSTNNVKTI